MRYYSDWVHLVTGIFLGVLGLLALPLVYLIVHREYLQESEKPANRAAFDLRIWATGLTIGMVGHLAIWVEVLVRVVYF